MALAAGDAVALACGNRRCTVADQYSITTLFSRLKSAGLDEGFTRAWLLPDWWENSIADSPSGLAMAELYITRMTGLSPSVLRQTGTINLEPSVPIRFKKRAGTDAVEIRPAAAIAVQVARGLVDAVRPDLPRFKGIQSANALRSHILGNKDVVNLQALIDCAWELGIIVGHMAETPAASKKFDGLAMFVGPRPVVILGSGRDSSAWLAFHLGHELGHILLGHVVEGGLPLSDFGVLDTKVEDADENDANRFASELLTGETDPKPTAVYGLTGKKLAHLAQERAPKHGIDPGVLALVYGWGASRLPAAQNALKELRDTTGAHELLAGGLERHLRDSLPESVQMFVNLVVGS